MHARVRGRSVICEKAMAEKKKLHHFLNDMLKLSCVKGFKHFATHMRGREEMVCSIVNEPSMPIIQSATNSPATSFGHHKRGAFPMSQKQQRRLSGYGFINVGLPPASPSENEEEDENQTMFLIAGYSRYNRPYVWVRTNHDRLVRLTSDEEKDYPLLLQTTSQWQENDVKVWDVLTELVEVCTAPCPPNPFAVDLDYFQSLQLPERALASAAMIAFLQKLIASGPHHYDRRIQSDLGKISRIHFQAMQRMLQEDIIHLPSSLPPKHQQSTEHPVQHTHKQERYFSPGPAKAGLLPAEPSSTKSLTSGANISATHPSFSPTVVPSSSTPLSQPAALFHSNVASRSGFTPPHYSSGVSPTPSYPAQPHRHMLPATQPSSGTISTSVAPPSSMAAHVISSSSGGQFYSRRMGGSYNY